MVANSLGSESPGRQARVTWSTGQEAIPWQATSRESDRPSMLSELPQTGNSASPPKRASRPYGSTRALWLLAPSAVFLTAIIAVPTVSAMYGSLLDDPIAGPRRF